MSLLWSGCSTTWGATVRSNSSQQPQGLAKSLVSGTVNSRISYGIAQLASCFGSLPAWADFDSRGQARCGREHRSTHFEVGYQAGLLAGAWILLRRSLHAVPRVQKCLRLSTLGVSVYYKHFVLIFIVRSLNSPYSCKSSSQAFFVRMCTVVAPLCRFCLPTSLQNKNKL